MTTIGTFEHDNLFAGTAEVVRETVIAGEALKRGDVVGIITENKKAVVVDSANIDGSEKPYGIVADDTEIDKPTVVYLTGEFNEGALNFGGADTADTHRRALRDIGIFLKKNQEA